MELIRTVREMQARAREQRDAGRRIGLVPTMGCLHEGHLSLIRRARRQCDYVIASIFVNPAQFGPGEDYERYPRDLEQDTACCREAGADAIFAPATADIVPPDRSVFVDEQRLSLGLCGRSRPGHFRGVLTVVAQLFSIVQPDTAVFGQKDAQQLRLIRQMVRDLHIPVEITAGPIVRESDGLAMSSRNRYLSPDERRRAAALYRALQAAEKQFEGGERETAVLTATVRDRLRQEQDIEIEYIALVDEEAFESIARIAAPSLLALAVRLGAARLIDNVRLLP